MPVVHISYHTDPACPWSWALEPVLRKLVNELGDILQLAYVMGGMAKEFGDPEHLIGESLDASERSGMPVDARLWLDGAPRGSYAACIAVKAAAEQGCEGPYLRRLREGLMCRRRKLDTADALLEEARAVRGIDLERFRIDLGSHAILEAFGADLERTRQAGAALPSLELRGPDDGLRWLNGFDDCLTVSDAVTESAAKPKVGAPPSIEEALRRFGTMATPEVAAVCELPGPRAPAELWRLALEWRVKPERVAGGELWTLA